MAAGAAVTPTPCSDSLERAAAPAPSRSSRAIYHVQSAAVCGHHPRLPPLPTCTGGFCKPAQNKTQTACSPNRRGERHVRNTPVQGPGNFCLLLTLTEDQVLGMSLSSPAHKENSLACWAGLLAAEITGDAPGSAPATKGSGGSLSGWGDVLGHRLQNAWCPEAGMTVSERT